VGRINSLREYKSANNKFARRTHSRNFQSDAKRAKDEKRVEKNSTSGPPLLCYWKSFSLVNKFHAAEKCVRFLEENSLATARVGAIDLPSSAGGEPVLLEL
jgi:hypothetical protein